MVRTTVPVPTTPLLQTRKQNIASETITSPPTPHRIELRNDSAESNNCKKSLIESVKPLPKAKRRLNNQIITQSIQRENHKLTEYFPVRRSVRKTTKTVLEEKQRNLEEALRSGKEEGLEVKDFNNKGRGVVSVKNFTKGDFVIEYSGDLIDTVEAKVRETKYALDQNAGCYMYYFKHNDQQYCIDATFESGKLGRLVNHSRNGNLIPRSITIDNKPRLVLIAKDDINIGEELLYDYGDRSKESLKHHPWLAN